MHTTEIYKSQDDAAADQLAEQLDLPRLADERIPLAPVTVARISSKFMRESNILPLEETEDTLLVGMAAPEDRYVISALRMATGKAIQPYVATTGQIQLALERLYGDAQLSLADIADEIQGDDTELPGESVERLKDLAAEAPIVRLVNRMLDRALEARASDVHVEPFESQLKVRYRIDGVLQEVEAPPARYTAAIISRLKIMARLNIAERRLPQDGRIQLQLRNKKIDLRVSTVPTVHGESVVMRILDKGGMRLELEALGFTHETAERLRQVLALPHGILLVTGPTGSGKTTTLYSALQILNTPERKVLTVEDPVEYQLDGINQIQVKPKIELTFANALRAIVRQDPDVIMIGEMRDLETARIAVQSALTGHMVLSTLHTNDAGSSITRLLDMGMEDFLLTSTLNGVLAQRLVRKLCEHCKRPYKPSMEWMHELGMDAKESTELYQAMGCDACMDTGYLGRMVIHELLLMNEEIRRLILAHSDGNTLQQKAVELGMHSMRLDGFSKAQAGITSVEEVLRVTQDT